MKKEKKKRLHRIAERVKRRKAERIVDTVEGKLTEELKLMVMFVT